MSEPAAVVAGPGPRPDRPHLTVVPTSDHPLGVSPAPAVDPVRGAVTPVLAGLVFPARRWQVLAESDSWGATGPIRNLITGLPDGVYRDLDTVVAVLRMLHGRRRRPT